MHAVPITIFATAGLAMFAALFGVVIARSIWADDLKHTQELKHSWDKQRTALEETIEHQRHHIAILKGQQPQ